MNLPPNTELFALLPDFRRRCADANHRVEGGEHLTYQEFADQLGLPLEFTMAAVALATALKRGGAVVVDASMCNERMC
jgi:hypothetical protein